MIAKPSLLQAQPQNIDNVSAQITTDHRPTWGLIDNAGIWLEGEFTTSSSRQYVCHHAQ